MTAVTAIAAFGFIAYNLFVSKPGTVPGQTSLSIGAFVALGGAIMMGLGAAIRSSSVERPRKPPGTI
jgi:drug/metabolite transporter (DMT)-like permease